MFREMGEPATDVSSPPVMTAPFDPAAMAAIAARHGTIIDGPPPLPR